MLLNNLVILGLFFELRKMRKVVRNLLIILIGLGVVFVPRLINASAETNTIDNTIIISSDTEITEDIVVDITSGDVFEIKNGATLTLNNININGSGTESITNIFKVNYGGKLILNSVTFSTSINASCGVYNLGSVEIYNTNFVSNIRTSINNNSTEEHSLKLYSGAIPKLTLNSGYVTVFDSTIINSTVRVTITNEFDGKLVVKGSGTNVFASKLMDKFVYNTKSEFFLDYIGDGCNTTNDDGDILNQGDIVITKYSLTTKQGTDYAGKYCTGNHFLSSCYNSGEFPVYKCFSPLMIMNNYYCNTSSTSYTLLNSDNVSIDLTVKTFVTGNTNALTTNSYIYSVGSNYAVFVDIPSGYELESISLSDDSLAVDNEQLFMNDYYMRPIVMYNSNEYTSVNCEISFNFSKIQALAEVEIINDSNVQINSESTFYIGNEYTFEILKSDSYRLLNVEFNNQLIELTEMEDMYLLTVTLKSSNTIKINALALPYEIVVTPKTEFSFVYGEEIDLTQEYYVEATNETIIISFAPNECSDAGTYKITSGTASNSDYVVKIADGDYYYTIVKQEVSLNEILLEPYEVTYFEDINISLDMFVKYIPPYFDAELIFSSDDLCVGDQEIDIAVNVNNNNYILKDNATFVTTRLTINPVTIDTSNYSLTNLEQVYDGVKKCVEITNLDSSALDVDFEFYENKEDDSLVKVSEPINSGRYYVVAELTAKSMFYSPNNSEITGYLNIRKCAINLTEFKEQVATFTYPYNGTKQYIGDMELPDGVSVLSISNNDGHINVGTYEIIIYLDYDKTNYICDNSVVSYLVITPLNVTVELLNSTYLYTGTIPSLKTRIIGVLDGDSVTATLQEITNTNVGEYSVGIISLSNPNYVALNTSLSFAITKAKVDLTNIKFDNIDVVYDGNNHLPVISGTLPLGISYVIDTNIQCVNVGVYNVKCFFTSNNSNYETPEDIYAKVSIKRKPIFVEFALPEDLVASGLKKQVGISFSGVVDGEELNYSVSYSGDCVLPGTYTCSVTLDKYSNYQIINNSVCEFIIYSRTASFVSDDINLTLEGQFLPNDAIGVKDTSDNLNIVNAVADMDFKSYNSFKVDYQNYSNQPVTIKIHNSNGIDTESLAVYRVVNNQLEEIDYSITNNLITFELYGFDEILIVEKDNINSSFIITITLLSLGGVIILLAIILFTINYRKKKHKQIIAYK